MNMPIEQPIPLCEVEGRLVYTGDTLYWKSQPSVPLVAAFMYEGWIIFADNSTSHPSGMTWGRGAGHKGGA